jgi:hypothetical protein
MRCVMAGCSLPVDNMALIVKGASGHLPSVFNIHPITQFGAVVQLTGIRGVAIKEHLGTQ